MRPRRSQLLLAVAAVVLSACAAGASPSAAAPSITDAWARPAARAGVSAAYFTITSTTADALVSVTSPGAAMVEMHETSTDASGVTSMGAVLRCEIPSGQPVAFKPGGQHLMLMGLTSDLAVGGKLELDLVFEHAGRVVVMAEIRQG